jgi:hypothetical protein
MIEEENNLTKCNTKSTNRWQLNLGANSHRTIAAGGFGTAYISFGELEFSPVVVSIMMHIVY